MKGHSIASPKTVALLYTAPGSPSRYLTLILPAAVPADSFCSDHHLDSHWSLLFASFFLAHPCSFSRNPKALGAWVRSPTSQRLCWGSQTKHNHGRPSRSFLSPGPQGAGPEEGGEASSRAVSGRSTLAGSGAHPHSSISSGGCGQCPPPSPP